MTPQGIILHSTGANNPYLSRYVAPDDGRVGPNRYGNHWNRPGIEKCPHAFIGKLADGRIASYTVLPTNICAWGCGRGSRGSYNYDPAYLQIEICEDDITKYDWTYFNAVMTEAVELCAKWCKEFGIDVGNVLSHREASIRGYASAHADIDHWLAKFKGYSMDLIRDKIRALLDADKPTDGNEPDEKPDGDPEADTVKRLLGIASEIKEIADALGKESN